jgi:hypothetical protein
VIDVKSKNCFGTNTKAVEKRSYGKATKNIEYET